MIPSWSAIPDWLQNMVLLNPYLNERQRWLVAAVEARFLGHGGIASGSLQVSS